MYRNSAISAWLLRSCYYIPHLQTPPRVTQSIPGWTCGHVTSRFGVGFYLSSSPSFATVLVYVVIGDHVYEGEMHGDSTRNVVSLMYSFENYYDHQNCAWKY